MADFEMDDFDAEGLEDLSEDHTSFIDLDSLFDGKSPWFSICI